MEANFSKQIKELRIPLYQREYKWTNEKIAELINDINTRDKFLGIVILDEHSDYYEIVDGQQRITTCFMALVCLYNCYNGHSREQASINRLLRPYNNRFVLENESVGIFIKENGSLMDISIDAESDIYYQSDDFKRAYNQVWSIVSNFETMEALKAFKQKLLDSQFLILINDTQDNTRPVEQIFLDINEKSQHLEKADIFKGHCFKNYGNEYAEELKSLWVSLKKCAVEFEKWGFEDFDEYIYTYFLLAVNSRMPSDFSIKGKHYLAGKSIDETEALLKEMIAYGQHAIKFHQAVSNMTYDFQDVCSDAKNYANSGFITVLKQISTQMLECQSAQYQKLPFFYTIHKMYECADDGEKWGFFDLQKIITNLYVYATLFVVSGGRKSKAAVDHSVYNALAAENFSINTVISAAQDLRKKYVEELKLPNNINKFSTLAEFYSVADFYVSNMSRLDQVYLDNTVFTLEHFIIPDNKGCFIRWKQGLNDFQLNLGPEKKCLKKRTINYIILPEALNGQLEVDDIITKIERIKVHYQKDGVPRHIRTVISHIELLPTYQELLKLQNETNVDVISEKYDEFIQEYFSDNVETSLLEKLKNCYKKAFQNGVNRE